MISIDSGLVFGVLALLMLFGIVVILYKQTKTEEEIQRELERHVIEHLKYRPCQPRRDSKGRFTSAESEDGV